MRSPTQPTLAPDDVTGAIRTALGPDAVVAAAEELTGGTFAAVQAITLTDGRRCVLKVGPPGDVPLLGYEQGLIAAEAAYFALVRLHRPAVPVPPVLHHGDNWLLTGRLPGRNLVDLAGHADDTPVRAELGSVVAALHTLTGPHFGYTGSRPSGDTWPDAFTAMVESLLDDARTWDVALPVPPERLRAAVAAHHHRLAEVTRPALLHVDLWDGNVLAEVDDAGQARLSGIVDGERFLYGDPLLDLVSAALFRRIEDEPHHPFLRGYAAASGLPLPLDDSARVRLALYRTHLYLLMLAEGPSRGRGADASRSGLLGGLLRTELDALPGAP